MNNIILIQYIGIRQEHLIDNKGVILQDGAANKNKFRGGPPPFFKLL